ncbi:MAG: hypothetical protein ACOCXQ_04410 [Patescibacteria group bacterium]
MDLDDTYKDRPDWGASELGSIVQILESIDLTSLTTQQQEDIYYMLHMYYHHQISVQMIWNHDHNASKAMYEKAMKYHLPENPNRVTQFLGYLINDDIESAKQWIEVYKLDMEKESPESNAREGGLIEIETMTNLLKDYTDKRIYFND